MVGKLTAAAMAGATGSNGYGSGNRGDGEYYSSFVATSRGRGNPTISVKRVRNRSSAIVPWTRVTMTISAPPSTNR